MNLSDPVLLIALPLAGSLISLVGKLLKREIVPCIAASVLVALSAVPLTVQAATVFAGSVLSSQLGGWGPPVGIGLRMDALAWIASAMIVGIGSVVLLSSFAGGEYRSRYFFFATILISGMQMVTLTDDIFTMFVGFEIIAIAAYLLIGFDQTDAGLLASLKYLILSTVGVLFFLIGVFLVYRDVGSLSISGIATAVRESGLANSRSIHLAVATLCVGIGVRTAFIPFHTWLPEAHAYAPHPVSALLSGVLIKVSLFAMLRILRTFEATYLNEMLLWIGGLTAIVSVVVALSQSDLKRLLAYHSISQMGYILAAFGAASAASYTGLYAHAVGHGLFKSLLFLAAGEIIHVTGTRNVYEMRPIGRSHPYLATMLIVGALSIAAIPPFVGFVSKQLATGAVGTPAVSYLLWATSVGTVASFVKVGRVALPGQQLASGGASREQGQAQQGSPLHDESFVNDNTSGGDRSTRIAPPSAIAMAILATACIAAGIYGERLAVSLSGILAGGGHDAAVEVEATRHAGADTTSYEPSDLYKGRKLLETLLIAALGAAVYALATSKRGHTITERISAIRPQLGSVLLFFVAGLSLFALFAYV